MTPDVIYRKFRYLQRQLRKVAQKQSSASISRRLAEFLSWYYMVSDDYDKDCSHSIRGCKILWQMLDVIERDITHLSKK
jgi:hypothetical protein